MSTERLCDTSHGAVDILVDRAQSRQAHVVSRTTSIIGAALLRTLQEHMGVENVGFGFLCIMARPCGSFHRLDTFRLHAFVWQKGMHCTDLCNTIARYWSAKLTVVGFVFLSITTKPPFAGFTVSSKSAMEYWNHRITSCTHGHVSGRARQQGTCFVVAATSNLFYVVHGEVSTL